MLVPDVGQFVHDDQTVLITGTEHFRAHGMMGAADSIESGFLHLTGSAFFRVGKGGRADDTIIVMDAGTLLFDHHTVDAQALLCIQGKGAQTDLVAEGIQHRIAGQDLDLKIVQVRGIDIPECRRCNAQILAHRFLVLREQGQCYGIFFYYRTIEAKHRLDRDLLLGTGQVDQFAFDLDDGFLRRGQFRGGTDTIVQEMYVIAHQKVDAAVDAAAGIPAAVRRGIVGDYLDLVGSTVMQQILRLDIEARISVEIGGRMGTVDIYHGSHIDAFEFEENILAFPLGRNIEVL